MCEFCAFIHSFMKGCVGFLELCNHYLELIITIMQIIILRQRD